MVVLGNLRTFRFHSVRIICPYTKHASKTIMRSWWKFTSSSSNLLFICLTTIGHQALICSDLYIPVSAADKHLSHPARYSDTNHHSRQFVQNHRLVVSHHFRYQSYHCRNDGHDVPLQLSMLSQWLVSQQLRSLPC